MIKTYTLLTKPGILLGNAITTASGFALASKGHFDLGLFFATVVGLGGVISSACVFNNYIDRASDALMERTKHRPLVTGEISPQNALIFANILGLLGIAILALFTNLLAVSIAFLGFFVYVVLYSVWKHHSTYGTIIGSIAGAVPPVVGYCAASNQFDMGALLLFIILVLWQMPHFFAIAMYRYKDYAAASIPVMPIEKGIQKTKIHMLLYIVAFIVATLMLTTFGYTGYTYQAVAILLGIAWLGLCLRGFTIKNDQLWGKQMFVLSLVVVTALSITMAVDVA